jgi:hypothetical protein
MLVRPSRIDQPAPARVVNRMVPERIRSTPVPIAALNFCRAFTRASVVGALELRVSLVSRCSS